MTGEGSFPLRFFLNLLSVFVGALKNCVAKSAGCLLALALDLGQCFLALGDVDDRMLAASAKTPRRPLDDDFVVLLELSSSSLSKEEPVELETVRVGIGASSSSLSFVAAIATVESYDEAAAGWQ
jgi:hypothetical protein